MDQEKKEIKEVKSFTLRPSRVAWLRQRALEESTPERTVSASAILESIIDEAMKQDKSPSPSQKKRAMSALRIAVPA